MTTSEPKKAILFLRVNRQAVGSREAADAHLAWQRRACEELAAKLGAQIVREYRDDGGAVRLSQRRGLGRLLDELTERRDATLVIASDRQRLARNFRDMAEIERWMTAAGARVVTAAGPNDEDVAVGSIGRLLTGPLFAKEPDKPFTAGGYAEVATSVVNAASRDGGTS